jgi:hypothetical protein
VFQSILYTQTQKHQKVNPDLYSADEKRSFTQLVSVLSCYGLSFAPSSGIIQVWRISERQEQQAAYPHYHATAHFAPNNFANIYLSFSAFPSVVYHR